MSLGYGCVATSIRLCSRWSRVSLSLEQFMTSSEMCCTCLLEGGKFLQAVAMIAHDFRKIKQISDLPVAVFHLRSALVGHDQSLLALSGKQKCPLRSVDLGVQRLIVYWVTGSACSPCCIQEVQIFKITVFKLWSLIPHHLWQASGAMHNLYG